MLEGKHTHIDIKSLGLRYKILIFLLVLSVIPLLIVGIYAYIKSSAIIIERATESGLNTVIQTANGVRLIFDDVYDMSIFLIQNEDVRDVLKAPPGSGETVLQSKIIRTQRNLSYLTKSKKYIHSFNIEGKSGVSIQTTPILSQHTKQMTNSAEERKGGAFWTFYTIAEPLQTTNTITMMRSINDTNKVDEQIGLLSINISEQQLFETYSKAATDSNQTLLMVDNNEMIVSAQDKQLLGVSLQNLVPETGVFTQPSPYGSRRVVASGIAQLMCYATVESTGWKIVSLTPISIITQDTDIIRRLTTVIVCISIGMSLLAVIIFTKKVLYPFKLMEQLIVQVENEDFDIDLQVTGHDEISALVSHFIKMSHWLDEMFNQVYQMEIKKKEAELKALQAQINPHFLYNTLDTIYWMAQMEKAPESASLINALSQLFRLSLNNGNEITTVRQEVEHLRNYIIIQRKRFEDRIEFVLSVEDKALEYNTVKLILQPLVENAITHGIEKSGGQGKIEIAVRLENDALRYDICDNGVGVDVDEIYLLLQQASSSNRGFGIKNVNDRIILYAGKAYGIAFSRVETGGTLVTVRQPQRKMGDNYEPNDKTATGR